MFMLDSVFRRSLTSHPTFFVLAELLAAVCFDTARYLTREIHVIRA